MMKLLSLLFLLVLGFSAQAQTLYEDFYFGSTVEDTCGTGNDILRPEHFIAYQTLDNTQDGEIDPTTCIDWESGHLDLEGADLTRPVFVRLVDFELMLPDNDLINVYLGRISYWNSDGDINIDFGNQDYCSEGLCCGMEVEVEIPDESGVGTAIRRWQQEFSLPTLDPYEFNDLTGMALESGFGMCFPTESFEVQQLNDLVMKFMFVEGSTSFDVRSLTLFTPDYQTNLINENIDDYQEEEDYLFYYYWDQTSTNYVFRFDSEGYPSNENRAYIDFHPVTNPSEQQTISIVFDEHSTFTSEPHTYFRGALVEGEDSLRHNLSIINLGALICFNTHYDVIIQKGWSYIHESGAFDFQGGSACLQLNGGSNMSVSENGLRYGQVGQGMFALYGGSNIVLEPNAYLHFDGKMLLASHEWDTDFVPVVMTLKAGAKLTFSEFAKLENLTGGKTKLLIRNQGGEIDLTNLTAEERASIEIVNEEVETKHITVLGNPVAADGALNFLLFESGEALVRVLDANGKLMLEREMGTDSPLIKLQLKGLPAGAYLLQVKQQAEIRTERFVIN
jgi:hypothetical protein